MNFDDSVTKYVASVEPASALFVAGRWTAAPSTFEVDDPATGAVIASVSNGTTAEAVAAVDAAHDAFDGWRRTPPRERSEILRRAYELMLDGRRAAGHADHGRERQGRARRAQPR